MSEEACRLTLTELAAELRRDTLSATEAMNAHCRRYNRLKCLNAFTQHVADLPEDRAIAKTSSASLLVGVPTALKDNIDAVGFRTTAGTPALLAFSPALDAPVTASLRVARGSILGKTSRHELSFGATTSASGSFSGALQRRRRHSAAISPKYLSRA